MVTQVERHERRARFNQPPGNQCLLTPQVLAVTITDGRVFLRQIEGSAGTFTQQQIDGLLLIRIQCRQRAILIESGLHLIKLLQQTEAFMQAGF